MTPITRAYHLLDADRLELVKRHGLWSATALMARHGTPEQRGRANQHRAYSVVLANGVVLTDQKPMPPGALRRCLPADTTPEHWYALLNDHVFFWAGTARLNRLRQTYADRPKIVLVVDAEALLARHGTRAFVTPINVGSAIRRPAARNRSTLVRHDSWRRHGWTDEVRPGLPRRARSHKPAELLIGERVDLAGLVLDEVRLAAGQTFAA